MVLKMYKISAFYKLASLLDLIVPSIENPYPEYKHEEKMYYLCNSLWKKHLNVNL